MKNKFKIIFLFIISFIFIVNNCSCNNIKTIFIPLSQSQNLYTQYHKPIYLDENCFLGSDISLTYRFQQSLNQNDIVQSLFQFNPLVFQGDMQDRSANALIPEYFGMSGDTNMSLYLQPRIRNNIIDLQLSISGSRFWIQANIPIMQSQWQINSEKIILNDNNVGIVPLQDGTSVEISNTYPATIITANDVTGNLYLVLPTELTDDVNRTYTINSETPNPSTPDGFCQYLLDDGIQVNGTFSENPIIGIGTWGDINFSQTINFLEGTAPGVIGEEQNNIDINNENFQPLITYPGSTGAVPNILNMFEITQNFVKNATSLTQALSGYTFGELDERNYNKFNLNTSTKTNSYDVADIILKTGMDFIKNNNCHVGVYLRGIIPTGTNINQSWSEFVFTPVIGNGRHFEFGIGLSGHRNFCCSDTSNISLFVEGYIDHVFSNLQFRTFDMTDLPMSRYALIKELQYNFTENEDISKYSYNGILHALGDINSSFANIGIDIHGEFMFDLIYKCKCFSIGIGYAFNGQSKEKICSCADLNDLKINNNLKLDGNIYYGFKGLAPSVEMKNETYDKSGVLVYAINAAGALTYNLDSVFITPYFKPATDGIFYGNYLSVKSSPIVTEDGNSGAYSYGSFNMPEFEYDDKGVITPYIYLESINPESDDVFILPNILENRSGLMEAQIINKIFTHFEYAWDSIYQPTLGFLGAFSLSPNSYFSMSSWEFGMKFGFNF